ncbi:MAG: hypothetical protein AVDCRST_MAG77-2642 [uncultured Chloroflexi bacterium]|uniref:histidine kinase n=1 Tax=uncultured Chloroflexota bacterium TaxID=166587 RepID=A0A6J4ISI0_9CHLR|nr:MAG: hypothetical protein AVDCRST_MAG77-2642 [uncultured Chloroflexota bacterium]
MGGSTDRDRLLRRLRELHDASLALAAPVRAEPGAIATLLKEIVGRAMASLGATDGALVLVEDSAWQDLVPGTRAEDGLITLRLTGEPYRRHWRPEGATTYVLGTGETVWVPDTAVPGQFGSYPELVAQGIGAFAIVPLRAGGRVVGRLGFNFGHGAGLDDGDREAMEIFAGHAAAALERARFFRAEAERATAYAAVRARDELLAVASHDLKNPLTVIRGTADALHRLIASGRVPSPERLADRLVRISDAAARMTAQLDELREDAGASLAAEAPGAPPDGAGHDGGGPTGSAVDAVGSVEGAAGELVDLAALAHDAIAAHSGIAGRHRFALHGDAANHGGPGSEHGGELRGHWSAVRLARVIDNLLSNAIKYSPNRSTVTVRLRREHAHDREWAVFDVTDQGIGIPAVDLPRVFDRFYRATNVPSLVSGSGIGLAAVRESVERMGGRVTVESELGKGSTFTVHLPLPACPSPP